MLQFRAATAIGSLKPKEAAQDRRCLAHRRAGKTRWLVEHDLPKDGNISRGLQTLTAMNHFAAASSFRCKRATLRMFSGSTKMSLVTSNR